MSLLLLAGCMAAPRGEGRCTSKPAAIVRTHGAGAEDMVALPLSDGRTRLFVREVCRGWWGCGPDQYRIGRVDIGPGTTSEHTEMAWRPPSPEFRPLGMSLLPGNQPGSGVLFVLDAVEPLRIWRLAIEEGDIAPAEEPWFTDREHALEGANDIQAIGDVAYVTRYDPYGFLPWRSGSWPGVVEVHEDGTWVAHADGLRGANGIINPGRGRSLVVSSYWERRLRFVGEDAHDRSADGHATAELPICSWAAFSTSASSHQRSPLLNATTASAHTVL
jgi:hypothetical protein